MEAYSRASITTKFIAPTNHRGARIKATCQAGSVTIPYPHEVGQTEAHWEAVRELLTRKGLSWGERWAIGSQGPSASGYSFTPVMDGENVVRLEVAS